MSNKFKEICLIALVIVAVVILIKISFAVLSIVFQLIEVLAAIGLIYLIIEYFKRKQWWNTRYQTQISPNLWSI